ncbi:alpha-glucosidase C-terminal domain-containing protein, partial [Acinetobacter baumannii]
KTLIALHKSKAVAEGEVFNLPADNNCMAYLRKQSNDVVLVILNLSTHDRVKVQVSHEWFGGKFKNVFSGLSFQFNSK